MRRIVLAAAVTLALGACGASHKYDYDEGIVAAVKNGCVEQNGIAANSVCKCVIGKYQDTVPFDQFLTAYEQGEITDSEQWHTFYFECFQAST